MGTRFRQDGSQRVRLISGACRYLLSPFRQVAKITADSLFPPTCIVCGADVDAGIILALCPMCAAGVQLCGPEVCPICGAPRDAPEACLCRDHVAPLFDHARSPFIWSGPVRDLVLALKYSKRWELARQMSLAMAAAWAASGLPAADIVTAVPLTPRRYLSRGYNQAGLLATGFSKATGMRCDQSLLNRTRFTTSTRGAGRAGRRELVSGAFSATPRRGIDGMRIILVDDVLTTGATASECAGVLKDAGASAVDVVSFARAVGQV